MKSLYILGICFLIAVTMQSFLVGSFTLDSYTVLGIALTGAAVFIIRWLWSLKSERSKH